ncbi:MAG: nicotinamidase/pyrazinamidase [SAR324 cluster bacterium]|uniref:Nicotinamidase n=1 Tax=SAR324 cluster bacterium TaxID=2024889 RepID=A0A2A4SQ70_9DELT|nr:MAG: nicotinamidase/pyrazinamidase [SAR324 cluster bacterium]
MDVLLLVDIQNDFCPGGSLAVSEGDLIVPLANSLMQRFEMTLATQDWHPAGHGSFASSHEEPVGSMIDLFGIQQILWPDHCVQNTLGADFHVDLQQQGVHKVFKKGIHQRIDSYSGFFENDHFTHTQLDNYLKGKKVTNLFIMGLATDYCVKFTALDAIKLGYNTTVIIDGCRGVELSPGDMDRAIEEMQVAGVRIIHSSKLL